MPTTKKHKTATTIDRRARNVSGGSSRTGLNLHFTQKETVNPAKPSGVRQNGHAAPEGNPRPYARTNSAVRIHSGRDIAQPGPPTKRVTSQTALPNARGGRAGKPKAGFTIASPSTEDSDEEEWISSENPSAVATPTQQHSSDEDDEEDAEAVRKATVNNLQRMMQQAQMAATPRAEVPQTVITAPTPTADPRARAPRPHSPDTPPTPSYISQQRSRTPPAPSQRHAGPSYPRQPSPGIRAPPPAPVQEQLHPSPPPSPGPHRATQSATTSPTQPASTRPPSHRGSLTRPPSTYSISSRPDASLRPHPLIRGHSHGRDSPLRPLTVTSGARAQLSASPPSAGVLEGKMSTSPSSLRTLEAAPSSPLDPRGQRQIRRTSVSSVGTMPPPDAVHHLRQQREAAAPRTRTLSTLSNASGASLAALASFASHGLGVGHYSHHHQQPVKQPPHFTVHFPPATSQMSLEAIHPLLPEPYLSQHLSMIRFRKPLRESFERVMTAKYARER